MYLRSSVALLPLTTLIALGCTVPPLASEAPLAVSPVAISGGEWRVVDNIFVVTDASGSMYAERTFPNAKALSRSLVAALPETTEPAEHAQRYNVASIGFGGDERTSLPLQPFDRNDLRSAVDSVEIMGSNDGRGGMSPFRKVFDEIAKQLEGRSGKTAIIMFTDGEPDDAEQALAAAEALSASHMGDICFHGVQSGSNPSGERFLRTLSEISSPCGSYRNASTVGSATTLAAFTHGVMVGNAPRAPSPPAVSANACEGITLRSVQFAFDRAELLAESSTALDRAATQLQGCPKLQLRVEGHTDSRGTEKYNLDLSTRRAEAVSRYLEGAGIDGSRLRSIGVGESEPRDANTTDEGRQRNRRVDLQPL